MAWLLSLPLQLPVLVDAVRKETATSAADDPNCRVLSMDCFPTRSTAPPNLNLLTDVQALVVQMTEKLQSGPGVSVDLEPNEKKCAPQRKAVFG